MKKTTRKGARKTAKKSAFRSNDAMELNTHSILEVIKEHHTILKADAEVLKSERASIVDKKTALRDFIAHVKAHAHAEAEILYVACEPIQTLKGDTLEGYIEHDTAERLLKELDASDFQHHWTEEIGAKAKVFSELILHHVREEENDYFPKIVKNFTHPELVGMADPYIALYEAYLAAAQTGPKIPSMDEIKETINKSWKQAYGKVTERVSDYVKNMK